MATNSLLINPAISHSLPYDTAEGFRAGQHDRDAAGRAGGATSRSRPTPFAERGRGREKSPEPINYTSPGPRGVGASGGRDAEAARRHRREFTHINYNGSAPALTDVIAGRVPLMFDIWHSARRHVECGRAQADRRRQPRAAARRAERRRPSRRPIRASSVDGVQRASLTPGGTPAPVVEKLSADVRAVVALRRVPGARARISASTPMATRRPSSTPG